MKIYKINELLEHTYYQIPQELFNNEKYKSLSLEAKVIYSFLLNRMNLSKINHWVNKSGEIYLIYTRKEIQSKLNLSDKPVTKAFKELRDNKLIKEKKQGFGKPNLIFIGKIEHNEIGNKNLIINSKFKTEYFGTTTQIKEDYNIEKNTIIDTEYLRINKKDNIKLNNKNNNVSQLENELEMEKDNLENIK